MRLALIVTVAVVLALFAGPAHAAKPTQAQRDANTLRFFRAHPALAKTQAGKIALLEVRLRRLSEQVRSLASARATPEGAIRYVFGEYADQALAVAWCESRNSVWARNGQYENLFQMGYNERRTYGWHTVGSSPLTAARAAYRYFVASGRDWSPWSCKP